MSRLSLLKNFLLFCIGSLFVAALAHSGDDLKIGNDFDLSGDDEIISCPVNSILPLSQSILRSIVASAEICEPSYVVGHYGKSSDESYWTYNKAAYSKKEYDLLTKETPGAYYRAKISNRFYEIRLGKIDKEAKRYFTEGGCWMLMRQLHDIYSWEMRAVKMPNDILSHGFCLLPNGKCLDINGLHSKEEILKAYHGEELVEPSPQCLIGQNIDHEPLSMMSTERLARIFAKALVDSLRNSGQLSFEK